MNDFRGLLIGVLFYKKEAKRMPGVKKQFQESENSSKPAYIFGHLFGGIGRRRRILVFRLMWCK